RPMDEDLLPEHSRSSSFPVSEAVACATCGQPVDPLRANRIRLLQERFRYFCSDACADGFDVAGLTPLPQPRRRRPVDVTNYVIRTASSQDERLGARRHIAAELNSVIHADDLDAALEREHIPLDADPEESSVAGADAAVLDGAEGGADVGTLLLTLAMLGGALSVALVLAGTSSAALVARLVVVGVACGALVTEYLMGERDLSEPHPAAMLAAPLLSTLTALVATLTEQTAAHSAVTLAAFIVGLCALNMWLVRRARRPLDAQREQIAQALEQKSQRVIGEEALPVRSRDLR